MENLHDIFIAAFLYEVSTLPRGAKAKLAENLKISSSRLADYISGRVKTSEEIRREIARFFGYAGPLYDFFIQRGRDIIANKQPSTLKAISIFTETADITKELAKKQKNLRIGLGIPLDHPDIVALDKIIFDLDEQADRVDLNNSPSISLAKVPLFDAGAGEPCEFYESWRNRGLTDDAAFVYVDAHKASQGAFGIKVHGDSMAPTIEQGDIVIVMPDRPIENGKIVLACWPTSYGDTGKRLIKRYKSDNKGNIVLWSDNPNHEPVVLDRETDRDVQLFLVIKLIKDL